MRITSPWEIWDIKTWTMLSRHESKERALFALKTLKARGKRIVLMFREDDGSISDPNSKTKVWKEPSTRQIRKHLRRIGAPTLPGLEDERQNG